MSRPAVKNSIALLGMCQSSRGNFFAFALSLTPLTVPFGEKEMGLEEALRDGMNSFNRPTFTGVPYGSQPLATLFLPNPLFQLNPSVSPAPPLTCSMPIETSMNLVQSVDRFLVNPPSYSAIADLPPNHSPSGVSSSLQQCRLFPFFNHNLQERATVSERAKEIMYSGQGDMKRTGKESKKRLMDESSVHAKQEIWSKTSIYASR
ncbi:hypothetical protein L7F22_051000 [Adiantum nelumboides]|nr:hypothetical protein [Adiantum nelumboides]